MIFSGLLALLERFEIADSEIELGNIPLLLRNEKLLALKGDIIGLSLKISEEGIAGDKIFNPDNSSTGSTNITV